MTNQLFELRFFGFEALYDLEERLLYAIENADLDPEFQGTLVVTVTYEEEDELLP